jgi:hypothetical protein
VARTHLVWDWNGTLLDDLTLVVSSTNEAFASAGGRSLDADEHRRVFRRPVAEFYAEILERAVDAEEFERLDRIFHDAYRVGLTTIQLAADAKTALKSWPGGQSLLSMWFHEELVPALETYGLAGLFTRVDGLRTEIGGDLKAGHLARHRRGADRRLAGRRPRRRVGGCRRGALHRRLHPPGAAARLRAAGGRHPGGRGHPGPPPVIHVVGILTSLVDKGFDR